MSSLLSTGKQPLILCLILGCAAFTTSCGVFGPNTKKDRQQAALDHELPASAHLPTLNLYQNCQEIQADTRSQLEIQKKNQEAMQAYYERARQNGVLAKPVNAEMDSSTAASSESAKSASSGPSAGADGATNIQEKGVDEADFVKIGKHHIFVYKQNVLKVSDRTSLSELGEIGLPDLTNVTLYTKDDRLILMAKTTPSSVSFPSARRIRSTFPIPVVHPQEKTVVKIFSTSQGNLPNLIKEHSFPGNFLDSRMLEDQLIIVFRDALPLQTYPYGSLPDQPLTLDQDGATIHGVGCSSIVKPLIPDVDLRMSRITALDTKQVDKNPQHLATVGGGDLIYMTTRNIYLAKYSRIWWPWIDPSDEEQSAAWEKFRRMEYLYLTKVSFTRDGQLVATAAGSVIGRVKDQWAFKELPESNLLSVATTTGRTFLRGRPQDGSNHLYVLEQNGTALQVAAPVQHFAPGENIRAVRYVGNIAYIVTFKNVDPLFAFDLSQPRAPKILGELKIPGFSTYMHPLSDGRLLGIGFDAIDQGTFATVEGVQVSLFDISNPTQLARLDNHILGRRGTSSEITSNHHAFFYDAASKLVGVPVVLVSDSISARLPSFDPNFEFSGALMYRFEGDKLREVARISHTDLMPQDCKNRRYGPRSWQGYYSSLDINRLYTVDGRLLSISRFGIKAHSTEDPNKVTQAVAFTASNQNTCL